MGKHKKVMKMRDFKNNLSPEIRDTEYTNGLRCSKGEIRYIVKKVVRFDSEWGYLI